MRSMVFEGKETEQLSPGVTRSSILPGGKDGPNGEVHLPTLGGQVWTDSWTLGTEQDDFQLRVPDIRMPPNQYWPLHWHGCWIAVVVLDGQCLIGDWWMQPGDVLISPANLEYGPVVNGPAGSQLFEIFAQQHLSLGGYGPEYHDHPTLQDPDSEMRFNFEERTPENARNRDNETLPMAEEKRLIAGHLGTGGRWDLGEADDPSRGVLLDTLLEPGEKIAPHHYADWRAIFVLDGEVSLGGRRLGKNEVIVIEPNAAVAELVAGDDGAQLLEVARTAAGAPRIDD